MANKKLDSAFDKPKRQKDEAEDFISAAEVEAGKKSAYTKSGKEALSARKMCISLTVKQEEAIGKLSTMMQVSRSSIVRDAIDTYISRHKSELKQYDDFFAQFKRGK